jgi:hypothetical protein
MDGKIKHFALILEEFPKKHPAKVLELLTPSRETQIKGAKDLVLA